MTTNYQPKPYLTQEQFADKVVRAQSNEIGMLQERVKSLLADLERAEAELKKMREQICTDIKVEDDRCVTEGDYMLDSDDCISIVRGTWTKPDFALDPINAKSKPAPEAL